MYRTISEHIMCRCHCRFCCIFYFLRFVLADVGMTSIYARGGWEIQQFQLLCDHQELACTPKNPPRQVSVNEMNFKNMVIACCNRNYLIPTIIDVELLFILFIIKNSINECPYKYMRIYTYIDR